MRYAIGFLLTAFFTGAALADGESRPTTPQEKAYSLRIQKALRASLDGALAKSDWMLINDGELSGDQATVPGQESRPYYKSYNAPLTVKPDTARAQRLQKTMDALAADAAKQMRAGKAPGPEYDQQMNALGAEQQPILELSANQRAGVFTIFEGNGTKWQKISVPGTKYAVRLTQATTADAVGKEETFLYLGSFAEPRQREDSTVAADGGLKMGAANELTVQNVYIHIQAPAAVADELIKGIDLNALNTLIDK